jgi:hypothetical protein
MIENADPYENALAEGMNGSMKGKVGLGKCTTLSFIPIFNSGKRFFK